MEESSQDLAGLLDLLIKSIKYERLSPVLYFYQQNMVDAFRIKIETQKSNLESFVQEDEDYDLVQRNFRYSIYKYEIVRLEYLLKTYLRTRLEKIRRHAFFIVKDPATLKHLSEAEAHFCKEYARMRYLQYEDLVLKDLHKSFRSLDGVELIFQRQQQPQKTMQHTTKQTKVVIDRPDPSQYSFVAVHKNTQNKRYNLDVPVTNIPSKQYTVLQAGDVIFLPYAFAENLVNQDIGKFL